MPILNLTLQHLIFKHSLSQSPLLNAHNSLTITSSKFSYFLGPCAYSSLYTKIHNTDFNKFLSQVIINGKINSIIANISCASFREISTSSKGSVFSYNSTNVSIDKCSFTKVLSTSFPACFYIYKSSAKITKCTFSYCNSYNVPHSNTTTNRYYGNAFLCECCNNIIQMTYTLSCATESSLSGDSAIVLYESQSISVSYINSSKCVGSSGSASLTTMNSNCANIHMSFLTVTDSADYCAVEIERSQNPVISYANIINSKSCKRCMINNLQTQQAQISYGNFINPTNIMFETPENIIFDNCTSNEQENIEGIKLVDDDSRLIFNLHFYKPLMCGTFPLQNNFHFLTRKHLMFCSILLFFSNE